MWAFKVSALLSLFCIVPIHVILAQSTCSINGITYMEGEALGDSFTTRCGSAQEFPCFCRPNATSQIDCPYCGIATEDNTEGLVCARIDDPFINITTLEGDLKECACRPDATGNPETVCFNRGSTPTNNNGDAPSTSPPSDGNVCILEWADGSVDTFTDGQSYGDLFRTQCGPPSDYPCFCNVSIPGKLYCPYCSVSNSTGGVTCGRIGETFQFVNETGQDISCQCNSDLSADCSPISTTGTPEPTVAPTMAASSPTIRPLFIPSPTMVQTTTSLPTLVPTMGVTTTRPPSQPLPTFDKPSILLPTRTPPVSIPIPGCSYINETTGQEEFTPKGESLLAMEGPCSPLESFPVVCNPALPGGVEYPYCVFVVGGGNTSTTTQSTGRNSDTSVICGKNGDQVQVPTAQGTMETCSCLYLNPFIGAVSSCPDLIMTIALVSTMTPNTPSSAAPPSLAPNLPLPVPNPGQPTTSPEIPTVTINSSGHAIGQQHDCRWSLMTSSMMTLLFLSSFTLFST